MALISALIAPLFPQSAEPPLTWVDPDTGHRVIRLTTEPNSASLYFNQNGYTAGGKKMVYTTPDGISALDLETGDIEPDIILGMRGRGDANDRKQARHGGTQGIRLHAMTSRVARRRLRKRSGSDRYDPQCSDYFSTNRLNLL